MKEDKRLYCCFVNLSHANRGINHHNVRKRNKSDYNLEENWVTILAMACRERIVIPLPIPSKLQDLMYAFRESKVLFAACDMGVFDILQDSDAPQSVEDISSKMGSNVDATECLMNTLVTVELLEKKKQDGSWLYSNSVIARQFLTKSSPDSLIDYIKHSNKVIYPLFSNLENAIREGSNQWMRTFGHSKEDVWKDEYSTEGSCLQFLSAMHGTSRRFCHAVATAFDLSKLQSCCDLGGRFSSKTQDSRRILA